MHGDFLVCLALHRVTLSGKKLLKKKPYLFSPKVSQTVTRDSLFSPKNSKEINPKSYHPFKNDQLIFFERN